MAVLFLLASGFGVALAIKLPETYSTNARLLVESPQIPGDLAASTVTTSPAEQLEIIQQRLLTRANLIDIANKYDLYDGTGMNPDEIVTAMREDTRFRRQGGRDQATLMTITFEAPTGQSAANVVNEYVTLILAANVAFRTNSDGETLDFFEGEVTRLGAELDLQRTRILDFQGQNSGALPANLEFRMNRQALLQERLARNERDRAALVLQRDRVIAVFEETGRLTAPSQEQLSPQERELRRLERELEDALILYSASNPRVRVLQSQVDRLRAAVAGTSEADAEDADAINPQNALYELTISTLESQISTLEQDHETLEAELDGLIDGIERTPANSIALQALERDYANLQSQYNGAVSNRAQAQMGERIKLTSRGQRISVIENARVPNAPSSPNRPMVAATGMAVGAGLAGALFVLLELLNRSIRRSNELVSRLGITPLATVPYMETTLRRRMRRGFRIMIFLAVLIGLPALLWAIDTYYLPLDILFARILDRLPF
jgi:uncharacterized protein involved in exopolysaccharide biosynthesis